MTHEKTAREALEAEALAGLRAATRRLGAETAELAAHMEETAQQTYELALDDFHGERGHRRIQDFADANRISYRDAMIAIGNEVHPKAPKPVKVRHGLTHERLELRAQVNGISYRDAMVELSEEGYVLEAKPDEEASSAESVEMSAQEERQAYGVTHREIETYAKEHNLSYRNAMIEMPTGPKDGE